MTVQRYLQEAAATLLGAGVGNAYQEARWLLEHALAAGPGGVLGCPDREIPESALSACTDLLRRRSAGEPLQYVMGMAAFRGLDLVVGPGVLIPRPETEGLVDVALETYPGAGAICDLCTGSGAVALALASELDSGSSIVGTDISPAALDFARGNRDRLALTQVRFGQGDLFAPIANSTRFALITANPPYISASSYRRLPAEIRDYEPRGALLAGKRGLAMVHRVAAESLARLLPGASLVCEIGDDQGGAAQGLFRACGYTDVRVVQDLAERDRIVVARAPSGRAAI